MFTWKKIEGNKITDIYSSFWLFYNRSIINYWFPPEWLHLVSQQWEVRFETKFGGLHSNVEGHQSVFWLHATFISGNSSPCSPCESWVSLPFSRSISFVCHCNPSFDIQRHVCPILPWHTTRNMPQSGLSMWKKSHYQTHFHSSFCFYEAHIRRTHFTALT